MDVKEIYEKKSERRMIKKKDRRKATPEEVIFIFEKILEGWKTIQIYNRIIQQNRNSEVNKRVVEVISTGNCKLYESEVSKEMRERYCELREKVYEYHKQLKILSKQKVKDADISKESSIRKKCDEKLSL